MDPGPSRKGSPHSVSDGMSLVNFAIIVPNTGAVLSTTRSTANGVPQFPAASRPRTERRDGPKLVDLSMNLPPEPDDPELIARMTSGLENVGRDLVQLLRYQGFGGAQADKDAASNWLGRRALVPAQERVLVTPGAHPAILAIFGMLAKPGETVVVEGQLAMGTGNRAGPRMPYHAPTSYPG